MNGITVWMAFVDAIPVAVFLLAALQLIRDFGEEIQGGSSKGLTDFLFVSSGCLMLFGGALLKLGWKFLYALNVCDYDTLSESFFPMQTIGFAMFGMGVLGHLCQRERTARFAYSIFGGVIGLAFLAITWMFTSGAKAEAILEVNQVLPYESHMPFLLCTFLGFMVTLVALILLGVRRKAKLWPLAFLVCMIFFIVQAVAGSMFDGSSVMHWVAQCANIVAQSGLLAGAYGIYRYKHISDR